MRKEKYAPEIKPRRKTEYWLDRMWEYLEKHPGVFRRDFLSVFGVSKRSTGDDILLSLERWGYLLAEDEDRLYPFRKIGLEEYNYLMCHQLELYHS